LTKREGTPRKSREGEKGTGGKERGQKLRVGRD